MRHAAPLALVLVLTGAQAAGVPPKPPPTGASGASAPSDGDAREQLSRVVEARVSTKEHLLPAALAEEDEADDGENVTARSILKAPQRALRRTKAWLRRENPTLWLALTALLVEHSKVNLDKQSELAAIRSQVRAPSALRAARASAARRC